MFDLQVPFFRPLWIRVAVTGFCLVWALVELVAGSPLWALMVGGLGIYAFKEFFVDFAPKDAPKEGEQDE